MSNDPLLTRIYSESETLEEQIRKFETLIKEEPRRRLEQLEAEKTTMPAPPDLEDRIRIKRFYDQLSKGQVKNVRRYKARNTLLFVLLSAATLSILWWIYASLQAAGLL